MEHASDCWVFSSILQDAGMPYHIDDQPQSVIEEYIYSHRPARIGRLHIPELDVAEEAFKKVIAAVAPAFLNEKARRRKAPENIRISVSFITVP